MNVRKLLAWRKVLIYAHRWLGILIGVIFVTWCLSGFVLMYLRHHHAQGRRTTDAISRSDVSGIQLTPSEAAKLAGLKSPMHSRTLA